MTFDLLPGTFLRALIKLGFCQGLLAEKICYDLMELVIGMDSKNIDKVSEQRGWYGKCFTRGPRLD